MKLHKFIQRICAATVASALTLSLCTPVLAEGIAALPAPTSGTSQPDETGDVPIDPAHFPDENLSIWGRRLLMMTKMAFSAKPSGKK